MKSGIILIVGLLLVGIGMQFGTKEETEVKLKPQSKFEMRVFSALEEAYFEGQKDYADGDIRIEQTDSGWAWTKSPWNDGSEPIFIPNGGVKWERK